MNPMIIPSHLIMQAIKIVKRYKYLGAIFSSGSPLFNEHIDSILFSALNASFSGFKIL